MAPRVSSDPDVQQHYAAQVALTTALAAALRRLWPVVDLRNLRESLPAYTQGVVALVEHFGSASASLSADHFDTMRAKAGITEPFRPPMVDPTPLEDIRVNVSVATSDLWDSRLLDPEVTHAGFDTADVIETTQAKVEGAAGKLVTDAGRNELIAAIEADRHARGYARVTKPGACAFCTLLAIRGAIYKSAKTFDESNAKFVGDDSVVKVHNNCHCTLVPLFADHYEPPAHIRDAEALYKSSTKDKGDKLNEFRRALAAQRSA